jgi:ParB/RepB/Spo0J family partition protein
LEFLPDRECAITVASATFLQDAMVAIRRIERVLSIQDVKPNPRNPRIHSNRQIDQIANSIKAFGFVAPIVVDETLTLIAGFGRLKAAERLGLTELPAIELRGLSAARKRALALADNKNRRECRMGP